MAPCRLGRVYVLEARVRPTVSGGAAALRGRHVRVIGVDEAAVGRAGGDGALGLRRAREGGGGDGQRQSGHPASRQTRQAHRPFLGGALHAGSLVGSAPSASRRW